MYVKPPDGTDNINHSHQGISWIWKSHTPTRWHAILFPVLVPGCNIYETGIKASEFYTLVEHFECEFSRKVGLAFRDHHNKSNWHIILYFDCYNGYGHES